MKNNLDIFVEFIGQKEEEGFRAFVANSALAKSKKVEDYFWVEILDLFKLYEKILN